MTKFEKQIKERTYDELIEICSNASDYQPEFIEEVKAHLEKRKVAMNNSSSGSSDDTKQLKAKPEVEIQNSTKFQASNATYLFKINENLTSIKNNVRFFFWLTIISFALSFLLTFYASTNH